MVKSITPRIDSNPPYLDRLLERGHGWSDFASSSGELQKEIVHAGEESYDPDQACHVSFRSCKARYQRDLLEMPTRIVRVHNGSDPTMGDGKSIQARAKVYVSDRVKIEVKPLLRTMTRLRPNLKAVNRLLKTRALSQSFPE